jgi:tetratricopeptide (TPR) repeat protein
MLKSPFSRSAGPFPSDRSAVPAHADSAPAAARASELTEAMRDAIDRCRRGGWKDGLPALARIAEQEERSGALPALVYSYLGYGIALRQQRVQEGLKLCQHAVKLEFYQAESYLNLARTQLLAGQRRAAVRTVAQGLQIEPDHAQLLEVRREVGLRRSPVLPFLSRSNPLNLLLGRLRHGLAPRR